MATAMEYTKEQLNYYRICYVVTDVLTQGLRTIFKQEWDNRYKTTLGEWKDEPRNGLDFQNGESPRNQRRNAHLLATIIHGNRAEWDCTMLLYAILYSDCIHGLSPVIRSNVDDLRKFRNEDFAHMSEGNLSDLQFQTVIGKVHTAFQALGLSTFKIQEIKNQTSFPTKELKDVLKKVDDLKQELQEKRKELQEKEEQRQVLEDQLRCNISPFCVLPSKPSHDVAGRDREVAEITQQLKELKRANESNLSYLYISGNPGSGKSQLAGLVAKRFFNEVKDLPCVTSFVMTVNGESPDTLLESYAAFSRQLRCPEYAVTNTLNSKDLTTAEKIANLKTLIGTKIELYTSWLLVVDNVTSISRVHVHLPEPGNEQWARGQLLITTQDTASIPLASSFIQHISVSKGMEPRDASFLLAKLSGITDSGMEEQVAQALDYQPLALASAATYVREARQTTKFGWNGYLEKLEKGQRSATESLLSETNPSYPKSMTTATTLAIQKAMTSDKVLHHTFDLLSVSAPQPLSINIISDYIMSVDKEIEDENMISMRIRRCSLLLVEEEETAFYIRVHQVVHNAIKILTEVRPGNTQREVVNGAIGSFIRFVKTNLSENFDWNSNSKHIFPHLTTLATKIEHHFSKQVISQFYQSDLLDIKGYIPSLSILGLCCIQHSYYKAAIRYFNLQLNFFNCFEPDADLYLAASYYNLDIVYRKLGDPERAKGNNDRLIKLVPEPINVAATYNNLGSAHIKLGEVERAKYCYDRALAICLKMCGPEHVHVATTYNNLGDVHSELGDLKLAKDYYDLALAIRLKKLGPEHVDVTTIYNNLGNVHSKMGNLEWAKDYYDRALAIVLKNFGPDHVDVAAPYNNLGSVHSELGDMERAKDYKDRALAILLKKLGPEHVDVATTYNNLGDVHYLLGDLERAKDCGGRALAIFLKKLGPAHVNVAKTYDNLGSVHNELGDLERAKDYHDRALAIRLKKFGPEHVDVATTYNNLGCVHSTLGDMERAIDYHDRALAIRRKKLGHEHVDVATTYNNLGCVHYMLGDLERAKDCWGRALAICLKKLGPAHVNVAKTYDNLGSVHSELGDLERAKDYHDRALAIRLKKLGPEHVDVANSYNSLGDVHSKMGDLDLAKDHYDRALAIQIVLKGRT